ncbi:hypothetical protein HGI30_13175 [Paenibacillus albicereus]|uniref:Uncharacterized protein n=1 Tax=Paenibacillus albicereus TaxID=2726185 RepID=A0A6H2GYB1_9BACL|nr:hypothetical protein [Paenibacillus albicereus]QJC52421.1 hypothetical protein HGI30_13175 [Paenibacillus albicereus]
MTGRSLDPGAAERKMSRIVGSGEMLSREDVIWALDYIRKKVADGAPALQGLPQPRWLTCFGGFAEASMSLLRSPRIGPLEADRLRRNLREALEALQPERP